MLNQISMTALDERAAAELGRHLVERLTAAQCDHTLRHVRSWAGARGIDAARLERDLARAGGFCDCETFNNVLNDPEDGPASARLRG